MAYPSKLKGKPTMQQRARNMQQSLQRRQEAKSDTAWAKPKAPAKKVPAVKPWKRYKRKKEAAAIASREKLRKGKTAKKKAAFSKLKTSMKKRAAAKKSRLAGPKKARTKTAKGPILTIDRKKLKSRMAKSLAKRRRLSKTLGLGKNVAARKKITQRRKKQQSIRDRYKE